MADLSLDDLHNRYTSDQQVKDANARDTVRTGTYRAHADKLTPQSDDRPDAPIPGRASVRIQAALSDRETGQRVGTVFFNASWEEARDGEGKPDAQSRLWGQFYPAFDVKPSEVSVAEMIRDVIPGGAFDVYVTEPFKMPEVNAAGKNVYKNAKTDEDRKALIEAGGEPGNFVQRVMRAKAV